MQSENKELVNRIARLVRQNKNLLEKNLELTRKIEDIQEENLRYKQQFNLISYESTSPEKKISKPLKFDQTTVLYAGIHGSAKDTDYHDNPKLMDELDQAIMQFDEIADKYKITKIKSIGDTLIYVGGVKEKNSTNPIEVVLVALEMRLLLQQILNSQKNGSWDIRFGIHSGSIFANINGKRKKNYEVKGDTLNIASRMEGWSDMGKINISAVTYELIKEFFICEYYGKMPVRYKGNLQMYTVKGVKPELSVNGDGIIPNDLFHTKFSLVKFTDLQEFMLDKLERELPEHLYYHNVKHTVDVVTQVELIAWGESVTDEEILLLKTAALFHDSGHIIEYDDHEYNSTVLAQEYLPKYNYSQKQIEWICELIMATKLPPNPKNKLEAIMCDADLDYLGRSDMIPVSGNLYKELKKQNKIESLNDWNKMQMRFISGHQYFTTTARNLREVNKQKQIERIKNLII